MLLGISPGQMILLLYFDVFWYILTYFQWNLCCSVGHKSYYVVGDFSWTNDFIGIFWCILIYFNIFSMKLENWTWKMNLEKFIEKVYWKGIYIKGIYIKVLWKSISKKYFENWFENAFCTIYIYLDKFRHVLSKRFFDHELCRVGPKSYYVVVVVVVEVVQPFTFFWHILMYFDIF